MYSRTVPLVLLHDCADADDDDDFFFLNGTAVVDEPGCFPQVKQVMNGVFHSLRGEFDVSETYSGRAVMEVIFSTIKVLSKHLQKHHLLFLNIPSNSEHAHRRLLPERDAAAAHGLGGVFPEQEPGGGSRERPSETIGRCTF